jgi:prolyl-tRNA synthetase
MNWSKALIPTLREEPKDAESKSHKLLLRAGLIRPLASGIYNYLPLGYRVIKKISAIIREEMERIGGQEFFLPALSSKEIWEASGRWTEYGDDMFRLKDRKGRDMCLCPTHEEIMTHIAAREVRSYKDLPQLWFQIQTKFRDEPRPRGGVLRVRQFLMKDSYSLDVDADGLDKSYDQHREAYSRIFTRCGIKFFIVEASGGLMGEGESAEFMGESETGEDSAQVCGQCGYKANAEIARADPGALELGDQPLKEVHTPNVRTVEEVAGFLGVKPAQLIKSMLYIVGGFKVMVLVRGDDEVSEAKLVRNFGASTRPATPEEAFAILGANLGFIGPVGVKGVRVYADMSLRDATGRITGANKDNYHVAGLNLARDAAIETYIDVRKAKPGDRCLACQGPLEEKRAIELGHIFKLGTKYSSRLNALFIDSFGVQKPIVMGSYGIGLERIMATAIEQGGDNDGIIWPATIAPFQVEVLPIDGIGVAETLARELTGAGIEVLLDDRQESPGVKFKDADLLGIPLRVTIGPKGLKEGKLDITVRKTKETFSSAPGDVQEKVKELLAELNKGTP